MRQMMILASASALGIAATAAELQRGRLMRAPDHPEYPKWAYGPGGKSGIFNSAEEIPAGYVDHPSKLDDFVEPAAVETPVTSANGPVSEAKVAESTTAQSQTITDPTIAAQTGVGGEGNTAATGQGTPEVKPPAPEVDAHGHPFDASLHAATRSKTKDGLWRMKVGVKRPDPAPGFPLDL